MAVVGFGTPQTSAGGRFMLDGGQLGGGGGGAALGSGANYQ